MIKPLDPKSNSETTAAGVALDLTLEPAEVEPFLCFMFSDIATKPKPIDLREGAGVARYLQWLSLAGIPSAEPGRGKQSVNVGSPGEESEELRKTRAEFGRAAQAVWRIVKQYGEFKPSTRQTAAEFLKRHLDTYVIDLRLVLRLMETHELPPNAKNPFFRPVLVSTAGTVAGGRGNPRRHNDLSERIFAAYFALPRAKLKKWTPRIALALNAVKAGGRSDWDWLAVIERRKGYEQDLLAKAPKGVARVKDALAPYRRRLRESHADKWISLFKSTRIVEGKQGSDPSAKKEDHQSQRKK
jgi:hypothetical protein